MGIDCGPAPDARMVGGAIDGTQAMLAEYNEHAGLWAFGRVRWTDMIADNLGIIHEPGTRTKLWGIPVVVDDTLPDNTIRLLDRYGRILAETTGLWGVEHPVTGPTQRLVCRTCGDTPPSNARYCIECGAAL